jgi:hypothetical protein
MATLIKLKSAGDFAVRAAGSPGDIRLKIACAATDDVAVISPD